MEVPENQLSIKEPKISTSDNLARQLPQEDVSFLVNNYTAPALAAAYQDRYAFSRKWLWPSFLFL